MIEADYFAARLKELREAAELTQQGLAERAGLSKGNVADLEQGRYAPTWPTVIALCKALGVRCDSFLEEPAERPEPQRGRPPKAKEEPEPPLKRPRGRPPKRA
jgi:transcriptional regulator with XRE-family HTH domain